MKKLSFPSVALLTTVILTSCGGADKINSQVPSSVKTSSSSMPSSPQPLSNPGSSYQEYIETGKSVPLSLAPGSSVEKWFNVSAGERVLVRVNADVIDFAIVDNQRVPVMGEAQRLIKSENGGAVFIARTSGAYGVFMVNNTKAKVVFSLTAQVITK